VVWGQFSEELETKINNFRNRLLLHDGTQIKTVDSEVGWASLAITHQCREGYAVHSSSGREQWKLCPVVLLPLADFDLYGFAVINHNCECSSFLWVLCPFCFFFFWHYWGLNSGLMLVRPTLVVGPRWWAHLGCLNHPKPFSSELLKLRVVLEIPQPCNWSQRWGWSCMDCAYLLFIVPQLVPQNGTLEQEGKADFGHRLGDAPGLTCLLQKWGYQYQLHVPVTVGQHTRMLL
jgi:hypothetical protein